MSLKNCHKFPSFVVVKVKQTPPQFNSLIFKKKRESFIVRTESREQQIRENMKRENVCKNLL
jgi:hypothetical protein